jgi:5'-nucleotidase
MAAEADPNRLGEAIEHVLVTNDDGIDSPGLDAVVERLSEVATVTVVAPAENVSGTGAKRSESVTCRRTADGYVVDGLPADCVAFGARGLDATPDAVVSGCNLGPNVGTYMLGRSGTVGAAVEAAWLGIPAVAVSAYDPDSLFARPADAFSYETAADAVAHLLPAVVESNANGDRAMLNVNVPVDSDPPMRLTEPGDYYDTSVRREGDIVHFEADYGPVSRLLDDVDRADLDVRPGSEQEAIRDGVIGVSPLDVPVQTVECAATREAVEAYEPR